MNPGSYFSNNEVPRVTVGYVPHIDDLMHEKGFAHPDYINSIIKCDQYLGSLLKTLKSTGYYDSTAIGIITDHGNFKADTVLRLDNFFDENGLVPYNRNNGSGDFDVNFGSMGFFNFHGDTWYHHPTEEQLKNYKVSGKGKGRINLIKILWNIPGVKLMYYREDEFKADFGRIKIFRKDEKNGKIYEGKIEYNGFGRKQKTTYSYDDIDIFDYELNLNRNIQNKAYIIDDWLKLTNQIDFPIVVDQIPRYFKNPRSCDIVVSTLGNPVFNYEHGKTSGGSPFSHDIGLRKSMIVPFIIGGSPEIPSLQLSYCKTTDMVPTLLDLLGIKPHESVVGRSILI
jgi:arylsulfatase A-like enzyme